MILQRLANLDDFKDFSRLAQIRLDQRRNKLPLIATNRKTKIKETFIKGCCLLG